MNNARLGNLVAAWLDETITTAGMADLELLLLEDESARKLFLDQMDVHAELSNVSVDDRCFVVVSQSEKQESNDDARMARGARMCSQVELPPVKWMLAIAAAMLLATGFWAGLRIRSHIPLLDSTVAASGKTVNSSIILDSIESASVDTTWYIQEEGGKKGGGSAGVVPVSAGDVIRVTSGRLELTYDNGVEIMLHSPAAYQVLTEMKARMLVGRLTATVSEAGKGFSVITPQATVVDLGTQFGLEVDNAGATDVVVFKGAVDVDYHRKQSEQAKTQRLVMGEAVRLDAMGTTSRISSIHQQHYDQEGITLPRSLPTIANVQDNIKRETGAMNYYEIVHRGMQEDALAYVDRIAHEWNGINREGMPSYLLGADYLKTFNADKYQKDIKIFVELDRPCKLYVFFDNRIRIPHWLSEDFEDTKDDIGLDTGPFYSPNDGLKHNTNSSGIGPGESVEDVFSVWVRDIPEPCVFKLGSTETYQGAVVANMYGIAAVPFEAL